MKRVVAFVSLKKSKDFTLQAICQLEETGFNELVVVI